MEVVWCSADVMCVTGVWGRTSNELGAGQPSRAKKAAGVAMRMACVLAVMLGLAILFGR